MFATSFFSLGYRCSFKPIAFRCDPEFVHDAITVFGIALGRNAIIRRALSICFSYSHPSLQQTHFGITFPNPIGLSAGFDKNAQLIPILESVGFGFVEVGSITGEPCAGNPKPRLWRLPKSKALMVWYGLKNDGCEAIVARLIGKRWSIPVGVSVARTNDATTVAMSAGIADYMKAFRVMEPCAGYLTINVSCPNTCGGEPFTTPDRLEHLLHAIGRIPTTKPIFIKLPADLSLADLEALLNVCVRYRVHGVILSNLTKQHDAPRVSPGELHPTMKGGISGMPTAEKSLALIRHAYAQFGTRLLLIASGGIFTAEDAYVRIRAGASLVQLITGMIYEGPQRIGEINRGLVELLKKDGFCSISEAIGADHRRARSRKFLANV